MRLHTPHTRHSLQATNQHRLQRSLLLAALACSLAPSVSTAAVLAGWDVHSSTAFGTSPLAASTAAANLTVGGLTRGSGVTTTGAAANRGWGGAGWNSTTAAAAITAGSTVSFSLSATTGYQVSISGLSKFDYRRSGAGATSGVLQYQVGSGAFQDAALLNYSSTANTGGSLLAIDLSNIAALQNVPGGTPINLRVVNFGASGASGTWYVFDTANTVAADLEVSGTVTASGPSVDGVCGSANGLTFPKAPAASLCSVGTASGLIGTGPWSWSCPGSSGGQTATCGATSSAASGCQ
jgi:hypothetical protein